MTEFSENIRAISVAAREDMQGASIRDKLGFYATATGLAAHQVGMEAALFAVGTNAYIAGNETVGVAAPLVAAAATGLFSLSVETGLSSGVARGLDTFNGATKELSDRFIITDEEDVKAMNALDAKRGKTSAKDKFDTALVAVGVGSAATVLMDYAKHPEAPTAEHRKVGMRSAKALAGLNASLGLALGGGILASQELGTTAVYDGVEAVADSPITYTVIGGLIVTRAMFAIFKHHSKRAASQKTQQEPLDPTTDS